MEYQANPFTEAIRAGTPQVGLWVSLGDNYAAEVVAGAGYDWVVIDTEHSPNDLRSVLGQLQAFAASPTTALVRPSWNDPVQVKRLLDIGAAGLVFPMVQSTAEAEAAVAATRYPPRGIRGFAGSTRANAFGRAQGYLERVEDNTATIVQVETRAALNAAVDIAAVDGVDGVFFGPADIAADAGVHGQPLSDEVWDLVRPVAAQLIDSGVPVGTLVSNADFAGELFASGFTFVACGSDSGLLARGADALLATMRNHLA
jgi:4-hydroxy-2-oxoheptanedioate aldolase